MRIIKPYGRSRTDRNADGDLRRGLEASERTQEVGASSIEDIGAFAEDWPELLMAQWISAIDKIAAKPKGDKGATDAQRDLRTKLGAACWDRLTTPGTGALAGVPAARLEGLSGNWARRIHPYGEKRMKQRFGRNGNPIPLPGYRGKWYVRFCGTATHDAIDAEAVADDIERHLTADAFRLSGGTLRAPAGDAEPRGLIARRASSIENNALRRSTGPPASGEPVSWTDDDVATYVAVGDPARTIRAEAEAEERARRRVNAAMAARVLYEHYGKVFVADGVPLGRRDAEERMPGLYALHQSVREAYTRRLKRHGKKTIAGVLPRNMPALLTLIGHQTSNRDLNALVRLGRIIHHEAGERPKADTSQSAGRHDNVAHIARNWPFDIDGIRFWTSDGQTEIKRTEAFVRAWRTAIAHGARTLTDWVDPERKAVDRHGGPADMLLKPFGPALEALDRDAGRRKARLLFGTRADPFADADPSDLISLVQSGLKALRHAAFHFRGVEPFITAMKSSPVVRSGATSSASPALPAARKLWERDQSDRMARVKDSLRGAHAEKCFDPGQMAEVWQRVTPAASDLALPRFNRVVERAQNAWKGVDRLVLPKTATSDQLKEQPSRHCQYVTLKLIYERGFRDWLEGRSAEEINVWIHRAENHTTEEARKLLSLRMNSETNKKKTKPATPVTITQSDVDATRAKAEGLVVLKPGESYHRFLHRLAGLTATEFRVQNGYTSDRSAARKQAGFLDNLQLDIVALAFDAYLTGARLGWLYRMDHDAPLPDDPTCDVNKLEAPNGAKAEDWQAVLYLVVHMIPVDEIGRLLHRLRWWSTGIAMDHLPPEVAQLSDVFGLYLDMHDAKFEGAEAISMSADVTRLFENDALCEKILPALSGPEIDQTTRVPRRGLRELLRFGDVTPIAHPFATGIMG